MLWGDARERMDAARMWHVCMTSFLHVPCAILEEKKITDNFRGLDRSGAESAHWLWMLSVFSEQAALVDQVLEVSYNKSC